MINYIVLLFKNNKKRKILKTFKTERHAMNMFNKLIKQSDKVIFNIEIECGLKSKYELGILKRKDSNDEPIYIKDNMGRNVKLQLDDEEFKLIKIAPFNIEDKIFDLQENKRITTAEFIEKYLNPNNINMISGLNNKIIAQTDEQISLFSLKTLGDVDRFLNTLTKYFIENDRPNIVVKDFDTSHRKYLYKLLEEKGYNKKKLYKKSTTHPGSK